MSNTIIYSDYNQYPGTDSNYDFTSGRQLPLLPDVNLFNSFSYTLYADSANSQLPSTTIGPAGRGSYADTGYRNGVAPDSTEFGVFGTNILKIPTDVNWVKTGGPNGNGVCQNERGDWFTEESLLTADRMGSGVRLGKINNTGTRTLTYITDTTISGRGAYTSSYEVVNVAAWPDLVISGSYNDAIFCYNKFEYTNDNRGTIFSARSLYELPEKIDNLVTFIPDSRSSTTLTFMIRVDWVRHENWGSLDYLSAENKTTLRNIYNSNNFGETGTDYHQVTHVVNNTNDYRRILDQILRQRQRSLEDQDLRYGQDFPKTEINLTTSQPYYSDSSLVNTTISGVTTTTLQ